MIQKEETDVLDLARLLEAHRRDFREGRVARLAGWTLSLQSCDCAPWSEAGAMGEASTPPVWFFKPSAGFCGDPDRIRTYDFQLRRFALSP